MDDSLYNKIAFTLIPSIGPVTRKLLLETFVSVENIFSASVAELCNVRGVGEKMAKEIKQCQPAEKTTEMLQFIQQHRISPLFITDPGYPQKLKECPDAPTLLYYKGTANVNAAKIISIVGTRMPTAYGYHIIESLLKALPKEVLIISGLAMGIDTIAHQLALENRLQTIGVLAHGLDEIYPPPNKNLAKAMLQQGGLLTEFHCKTIPEKYNFPKRNRVVAGIADATIVIETALKGGSTITADFASQYHREVIAVPGRITDQRSRGCIKLIQENRASIYTNPEDLLQQLNWVPASAHLTEMEKNCIAFLKSKELFSQDELLAFTQLDFGELASLVFELETKQIIQVLPGNQITLMPAYYSI
jgi:DNA processing protein